MNRVLLLCTFLCLVGCAPLLRWANSDSDGDGIRNAEEAARAAQTGGGLLGSIWAPAGLLGAAGAIGLRMLLKKKEEAA